MSINADMEISAATQTARPADDPLEDLKDKVENSFSTKGKLGNLELADIIDVQMIQSLTEHFYELVHIPMSVVDMNGKLLAGAGWQDICTKFHRVNAESYKNCLESEAQLCSCVPAGEFKLYTCKNNMCHIATPIMVNGWHCGNLFSGQFFFDDEPLDYDPFRAQAKQYGFDEEAYIAALRAVPRLSRQSADMGMAFLVRLAHMLSHMGCNHLNLARTVFDMKQAQALAAEREIWFHTLFNTIPLSAALIDPQTLEFLQFNYAAAENLGYTREEFAKLTVYDIEAAHPPAQLDELLVDRRKSLSNVLPPLETRHRTKSGEVRDVIVYGRYMSVGNRRVQNCVWEDVTEAKSTEVALLQSEKLASVGRMAATVAHEINNPLEMVTNCIYLAANNPNLPPEVKQYLETAERELHRVAHIAKRTLGFYRETTRPAIVDIRTLVDEVAELYDPKFTQKDVRLKIEHNGHCAGTIAIAGEIRQVISNLLTNAIDASRPKGMIRVRTSQVTVNGCGYTRVTVADGGAGISRANLSRIFEPFFTTKKNVGTGLGLWVSSEIIQKHEGKIQVRSVEGKGTAISVFLPHSKSKGAALP